mmetsp:Transcript_136919/g.292471  ORF Transcript_136919/g.292471 Transcript_136919/m.292471 type:complete len:123 (+) Transcript_136919:255-623(+)
MIGNAIRLGQFSKGNFETFYWMVFLVIPMYGSSAGTSPPKMLWSFIMLEILLVFPIGFGEKRFNGKLWLLPILSHSSNPSALRTPVIEHVARWAIHAGDEFLTAVAWTMGIHGAPLPEGLGE